MADVSLEQRVRILDVIMAHLGRLERLANSIEENFIGYAISSVEQQIAIRCQRLVDEHERALHESPQEDMAAEDELPPFLMYAGDAA